MILIVIVIIINSAERIFLKSWKLPKNFLTLEFGQFEFFCPQMSLPQNVSTYEWMSTCEQYWNNSSKIFSTLQPLFFLIVRKTLPTRTGCRVKIKILYIIVGRREKRKNNVQRWTHVATEKFRIHSNYYNLFRFVVTTNNYISASFETAFHERRVSQSIITIWSTKAFL